MNRKDFKITYTYGEPKDQKSDIFYCDGYGHNHVAKIEYKNKAINIFCDGEMRFIHNGITVRNNSQLEKAGIFNDSDIDKIDPNQWINNPWFDAYLEDEYDDHLDMVEGDIEESIKRAMEWLYANDL